MMKRLTWMLAVLILLLWGVGPANANYIQTFTPTGLNNAVNFTASGIYLDNAGNGGDATGNTTTLNGFILQNNNFAPFSTGGWGLISQAQDGPSGYFLYEGTNNGSLGPNGSFQWTVWGSTTTVTADTYYTFSFYLTNSEDVDSNLAIIQPFINGVAVGAGVSANGYYADGKTADQWQEFTFTWYSGNSTTADMSLVNQQTNGAGFGDDFGIDTIALTANPAPEPSSLVLLGSGIACLAGYGWRRRKSLKTA
jgi:hypothetical protein